MNRLLIVPILLWAGLSTHAQTDPAPSPLLGSESNADAIVENIEAPAADDNAPSNFTSSTALRRKKIVAKNGPYQGYHDNGELQFTAILKKSQLQGVFRSWYADGSICDSGKFVKDVPDGEWKGWYPDGKPRYTWHFSATKYFSLKNEMANQSRQKFFRIAQLPLYEGMQYFKTDYIFGQTTRTPRVLFRSKVLQNINFDPENVKMRVDRNTGSGSYIPPFAECLFHGSFISYYPDGRIREEGTYNNGMRDGLWEENATDGNKSRGIYFHGRKSGEWRTYTAKGKLLFMSRYNNAGVEIENYDFEAGE
jgi:antitoxin component YwqK of YwqJK toxin-antitoxin module